MSFLALLLCPIRHFIAVRKPLVFLVDIATQPTLAASTAILCPFTTGGPTSNNTTRLYRATTTRTTGATAPTHTSGTGSDGTVTWFFVGYGKFAKHIETQERNVIFRAPLQLNALDSAGGQTCEIIFGTGSPAGNVSAAAGSLFIRMIATNGVTIYTKSGVGTNGWIALLERNAGSTASRPAGVSGTGFRGYLYYDTDLLQELVYNGSTFDVIQACSVGTHTGAGAINLNTKTSTISNATGGNIAMTLAAPTAAQLGFRKIISMIAGDGTNTAMLPLTNIVGGSAATTAIFDAAGETLCLEAIQTGPSTYKWLVIKEHGVTLS